MLFTPSWDNAAQEPVVSPTLLKRIQTGGSSEAYKKGGTFHDHRVYFGEDPDSNFVPFDDVFADVVGVYFSTNGYIKPYGEDKAPGLVRRTAQNGSGRLPTGSRAP